MRRWIVLWMMLLSVCGCSLTPQAKPYTAAVSPGVRIGETLVGNITREKVVEVVKQLAQASYQLPQNACFNEQGEIIPSRLGSYIEINQTVDKIMSALPDTIVEPVRLPIQPHITGERLRQAQKIGGYTTQIIDVAPGRMENIRLTAKLLSNTIVSPEEEFSFNRIVGEPTAQRGFKPATVFVEGGKEEQLGGGMCQVSSTLYNAVLTAKLPIKERHAHSQPVSYVPSGKDATIYTDKDFRFVNDLRQPIVVRAYVEKSYLKIDLLAL